MPMLEKKVLTLACMAGILACGACFLPPLPEPKPRLPPALASLHRIAIQVEDNTGDNLFDPVVMSRATASNFNRLWSGFPLHADSFGPSGLSDGTLRISVIRKSVSCSPQRERKQFCTIDMGISFTVKAADGRILQSEREQRSTFGLSLRAMSLPVTWNSDPFRQEAAYALAFTAGSKLLVPEPSN